MVQYVERKGKRRSPLLEHHLPEARIILWRIDARGVVSVPVCAGVVPCVIDRDIRQNVGRALDKLEREAARDVPCLFVDLVSFPVLLFVMMAGKEGME